MKTVPVIWQGMQGLGDNIYQVPVVEQLALTQPVVLETPWPQLYQGIPNLTLVPPSSLRLRKQKQNVESCQHLFSSSERLVARQIRPITYVPHQRRRIPLWQGLCFSAGVSPSRYFLRVPALRRREPGTHVVIRPCTIRREWQAPGRNPDPKLIQYVIDWCRGRGICTILIADIHPPEEVYDGPPPVGANLCLDRGECSLEDVVEWVRTSRFVVSPVGFMVPLCMALGVPLLVLHGGGGGLSGPEMIDAPCSLLPHHVLPDNFCRCMTYQHECDKRTDLRRVEEALEKLYQATRMDVVPRGGVPASHA